ncbi:MAG TPA: sensor domain-containing diguanylate cyclase [Candidatus Krumholzibacteria bacterium]|nr:sensor domain-containing diguanylate cyclase [Candidatus Krumholzibacteria bacterium]
MRIYDRDFRYLLVNLVPQHRLSPDLRRDVDRALRSGDAAVLRRESVRALEELCESTYFERTGVRADDGTVVVEYRKRGGRFQLSVALPRSEWEDLGDEPRAPEIVLSGDEEVARAPVAWVSPRRPSAEPVTPPVPPSAVLLPDIIRSFTIADRSTPVWERLETLLESLERWLGFAAVRLDVIEDTLIGGGGPGRRVHVVAENELRANDAIARVFESGARRVVERRDADDEAPGAPESWGSLGVAPIFALGSVVGALSVYYPAGSPRDAMDANLDLAAGVVRQAIEFNHHFESLTSIDALTGIYNRQFFDRQMPVEIERAMRSGSALSMLVLDLDDFKRINDELGHKKGDEALVAVAEIIRKNLRKVDLAFRYGGEEVVILLPGTPEFEAVHTAERLRRVIQQHRGFRDARGAPREITVSVGVAVYPDTAKSADELFVQADEAMYRAKQRGKNQVVLYSGG